MPSKAGQIVIEVDAGTAKMILNLQAAQGKLREFGQAGVGSARQAATEMRVLEGNIANNTRAVSQFLVETLKVGPAINSMFAVFGGVAAAGMVWAAGNKIYDFFKGMQEAPAKVAAAFREMDQPLQMTNDSLAVSNLRLQEQIDKLQGKPVNNTALALAEAKEAADRLGESLDKDIERMDKVIGENNATWWEKNIAGLAGGGPDLDAAKKYFGGDSGYGGYRASMAGAGTSEDKLAVAANALQFLSGQQTSMQGRLNSAVDALRDMGESAKQIEEDVTVKATSQGIEVIGDLIRHVTAERDQINLETQHAKLQGQIPGLEEAHQAAMKEVEERKRLLEEEKQYSQRQIEDWKHLFEMRAQARIAPLTGAAKIDAEESAAIDAETERQRPAGFVGPIQVDPEKLAVIKDIFDQKRIADSANSLKEWTGQFAKIMEESDRATLSEVRLGLEIKKTANAAMERLDDIHAQSQRQQAERQARFADQMTQLGSGSQEQKINQAYQIRITLAQRLSDIEQKRIDKEDDADKKSILIAEQRAEYTKQTAEAEIEKEERLAELQRQRMQEMTGPLTSGIAGQIADLATGKKTDFGKMLQGVGHQMIEGSVKKILDLGVNKLGTKNNPMWVQWQKVAGGPGGAGAGDPNADPSQQGGTSPLGGILGSIASKIPIIGPALANWLRGTNGQVTEGGSTGIPVSVPGVDAVPVEGMAEGGPVEAGRPYNTYDSDDEEVFVPKRNGNIVPASKIGGTVINNDFRGTDIGVMNRVIRFQEASHASQPTNAVRAEAERRKRTPQRSGR